MVGNEITWLRFLYMTVYYIHVKINLKTEITGYPKNYLSLYMMLEDRTLAETQCWF